MLRFSALGYAFALATSRVTELQSLSGVGPGTLRRWVQMIGPAVELALGQSSGGGGRGVCGSRMV